MSRPRIQRGVTIFELMITIIVAAILVSIAVPSFNQLFDKNRLKGAAEELSAEMQFARSESIARNLDLSVQIMTTGADWCIGVDEEELGDGTPGCDCSVDPTDCIVNSVDRVVEGSEFRGVSVTTGNEVVTFESIRGLPDAAARVDFQSGEGKGVGVIVNPIGSVRLCSPAGSANLWEYPDCP